MMSQQLAVLCVCFGPSSPKLVASTRCAFQGLAILQEAVCHCLCVMAHRLHFMLKYMQLLLLLLLLSSPLQVLRFMSWLNTNSDSLLPWEARVTPAAASQAHNAGAGVALEYVVELCNRLGASPWINVHHLAGELQHCRKRYVRHWSYLL
jgi:hypothetical protein